MEKVTYMKNWSQEEVCCCDKYDHELPKLLELVYGKNLKEFSALENCKQNVMGPLWLNHQRQGCRQESVQKRLCSWDFRREQWFYWEWDWGHLCYVLVRNLCSVYLSEAWFKGSLNSLVEEVSTVLTQIYRENSRIWKIYSLTRKGAWVSLKLWTRWMQTKHL